MWPPRYKGTSDVPEGTGDVEFAVDESEASPVSLLPRCELTWTVFSVDRGIFQQNGDI